MRDEQHFSPALLGSVAEALNSPSGGMSGMVVHAGGSPP